MNLDASQSYRAWDNVEPVVLTYKAEDGSTQTLDIVVTKWGAITHRDLMNPVLRIQGGESAVNIPAALCEGISLETDMLITRTNEGNKRYVVKSVELLHLKSHWRCVVQRGRPNVG